jgi:hypothetical protein
MQIIRVPWVHWHWIESFSLSSKHRTDSTLVRWTIPVLQVYVGRRHHIGLSIDGLQYEVVLGGEQDLSRRAAELSLPAGESESEPLPGYQGNLAGTLASLQICATVHARC